MTEELESVVTHNGDRVIASYYYQLATRNIRANVLPHEALEGPEVRAYFEAMIAAAYIQGHKDGCAEQMRTEGTA